MYSCALKAGWRRQSSSHTTITKEQEYCILHVGTKRNVFLMQSIKNSIEVQYSAPRKQNVEPILLTCRNGWLGQGSSEGKEPFWKIAGEQGHYEECTNFETQHASEETSISQRKEMTIFIGMEYNQSFILWWWLAASTLPRSFWLLLSKVAGFSFCIFRAKSV